MKEIYKSHWDTARKDFPNRVYEDEDLFMASNFESGNGFLFGKRDENFYALASEPDCRVGPM